jgi:tRNA A37 threonylcarbamoyladenosine synthetase subunit TsaC/SUA5/YrdC
LRVPDNAIAQALLEELGEPLLGTTLILPGDEHPLSDPEEIRDGLEKVIDLIIDGGACQLEPTTIIDLSSSEPILVRQGLGNAAPFGL